MALMTMTTPMDAFPDLVVPTVKVYTQGREGGTKEAPSDGAEVPCSVQPILGLRPGPAEMLQDIGIRADYRAVFPTDPGLPTNSIVKQTHSNGRLLAIPIKFVVQMVQEPGQQLVWIAYLKLDV